MSTFVNAYTLTSALGNGLAALRRSLRDDRPCLDDAGWGDCDVPCYLGRVAMPDGIGVPVPRESRINRLVELGLRQDGFKDAVAAAIEAFGAVRCGLVLGTSTSGIDRTEAAYRELDSAGRFPTRFAQPTVHNPHAPADYAAERLGLKGPAMTVSAACASSAKVFATAKRWLMQSIVDAVVVGGVDSLCLSVIQGFHSLQLVSPEPCRPFAANRSGISLGEASGFALLTREAGADSPRLLGVGESCDAYHMSSAPTDGAGARLAMERALATRVSTRPTSNTSTCTARAPAPTTISKAASARTSRPKVRSPARRRAGRGTPWARAGMVESILCLEALVTGRVPGTRNTVDTDAPFDLLLENVERPVRTALTNSFGFGGNNCSVVFSR